MWGNFYAPLNTLDYITHSLGGNSNDITADEKAGQGLEPGMLLKLNNTIRI